MTTISAVTSIAASGLNAASARLQASASNIANAQSGGAAPGASAGRARTTFLPVVADQSSLANGGVKVDLRMVQPGYFMAYAPSSPGADKDGMEAMPDVDPAAEAVNQIEARQQFAANLRVIETADQMQGTALKVDI